MANISVKCLFCSYDCKLDYHEEFFQEDIYTCDNCPEDVDVAIHVHKDGHKDGHKGAEMIAVVRGIPYNISMWHPLCQCMVTTIEKDGNVKIIFKSDFAPDWTPTNIKAKLETLLTFL